MFISPILFIIAVFPCAASADDPDNPRYPLLEELKALLEKALTFYPEEERERLLGGEIVCWLANGFSSLGSDQEGNP